MNIGNYEIELDGDKCGVSDYNGSDSKLVIPSFFEVDGKKYMVTSINEKAFKDCESLESVTIPDSVTKIGEYAFAYCKSLESVVIPDSVTEIGSSAFEECSSLGSIEIPDSVTEIGDGAFMYCRYLRSVVIPNSVTIIRSRTFEACECLESVEIPDSVTKIEEGAFAYCEWLESVVIPDSVTEIGDNAFDESIELIHNGELDQKSQSGDDDSDAENYRSFWNNVQSLTKCKFIESDRPYVSVKSVHAGCFYVASLKKRKKELVISFVSQARKSSCGDFIKGVSSDVELKSKIQKAIDATPQNLFNLTLEQGQKRTDKWSWNITSELSDDATENAEWIAENLDAMISYFESLKFDGNCAKQKNHHVHFSIYCHTMEPWNICECTEEELQNFVDGSDDFDSLEELLDGDIATDELKEAFGYSYHYDVFGFFDRLRVSIDDEEEIDYNDSDIREMVDNGEIQFEEIKSELNSPSHKYLYQLEEGGHGYYFECDFDIQEEFDIKKLGFKDNVCHCLIKGETAESLYSYSETEIYYDGKLLDYELVESDPRWENFRFLHKN